eukprot:symbB.v1.2.033202.t1/scaffold4094.1/size44825/2
MKQLLGLRTRVTLRSSPRQDDQNLNLVNSCVGHAETALVSSTCTATAQSFQQGLKVKLPQKSWTFHDVPFRRLMLNDAQTLLTQRGPVFEINSTAY